MSTLCIVTSKFTEYIHISQGPCRNPIGNIDSAFREIPFDFDARLREQYGSEENSVWDLVQILVKNRRFQSNEMDQNFVVVFLAQLRFKMQCCTPAIQFCPIVKVAAMKVPRPPLGSIKAEKASWGAG